MTTEITTLKRAHDDMKTANDALQQAHTLATAQNARLLERLAALEAHNNVHPSSSEPQGHLKDPANYPDPDAEMEEHPDTSRDTDATMDQSEHGHDTNRDDMELDPQSEARTEGGSL